MSRWTLCIHAGNGQHDPVNKLKCVWWISSLKFTVNSSSSSFYFKFFRKERFLSTVLVQITLRRLLDLQETNGLSISCNSSITVVRNKMNL